MRARVVARKWERKSEWWNGGERVRVVESKGESSGTAYLHVVKMGPCVVCFAGLLEMHK